MQVNTGDAKNRLSELIHLLQTGKEEEILIANRGTVIIRMVLAGEKKPDRLLGQASGKWTLPEDIDASNDEVDALFEG